MPIINIIQHSWLKSVDCEISRKSSAELNPHLLLGSTNDELVLAAKLESIGMDVKEILESVGSNRCDQNCALWYLLLAKKRSAKHLEIAVDSTEEALEEKEYIETMVNLTLSQGVSFEYPEDSIDAISASSYGFNTVKSPSYGAPGIPNSIIIHLSAVDHLFDSARKASHSENPLLQISQATNTQSNPSMTGSDPKTISQLVAPKIVIEDKMQGHNSMPTLLDENEILAKNIAKERKTAILAEYGLSRRQITTAAMDNSSLVYDCGTMHSSDHTNARSRRKSISPSVRVSARRTSQAKILEEESF